MSSNPSYIQILQDELNKRRLRNKNYSLRAYARDLEVHPAILSLIMNGQRLLPLKDCLRIVNKLKLEGEERTNFLDSLAEARPLLDKIQLPKEKSFTLDESYACVIAEWEHYAVLTLFQCKDFTFSPEHISERLGISRERALLVMENLKITGLVKSEDGSWMLSHASVKTTEDVTSLALKASHLEALELARGKLEEVPIEQRDFSSVMIAIDPEKLPEIKQITREFQRKLMSFSLSGNQSQVFQMAMQLYPLSQVES